MRILTDGYIKLNEEKLKLSGISHGAPAYAEVLISELLGVMRKYTSSPLMTLLRLL